MPDASATPQRVLMTADTLGGVWTYALELSRALQQHGVEVVLATMGDRLSTSQRAEVRSTPGLTVLESQFKLEWMQAPWHDLGRAGRWLLQLEEDIQPDIVHLNNYVHGALAWRTPTLVVGHSCVLSWWEAVKGESAPPKWERYRAEVSRGLQAADLVLAPTRTMLAALERHYGCLPRSGVVPNGRDPALFPAAAKEPFIFAVGRLWDEAKNVAMLDAVAPFQAWPVYVAGDDLHPAGGQVPYRSLRALGPLRPAAVAHWLARAAIYALPARYEPFGLSVLEAGLAGCALVLGDIPSLREIWDDAALFIPPDDAEALITALNALRQDGARRAELAAQARLRARQFTPQRMLTGYLTAYRALLQAPQRRGGRQERQPTGLGYSVLPPS